jgi:hypothetical protein
MKRRPERESDPAKRPRVTQDVLQSVLEAMRLGELSVPGPGPEEAPIGSTDANSLEFPAGVQTEIVAACMPEHGESLAPLTCPIRLVSESYGRIVDSWLDGRLKYLKHPPEGAKVAFADAMRYISPRFKLVSALWWPVADELLRTYAEAFREREEAWVARLRSGWLPVVVALARRDSNSSWKLLLGRKIGPGDAERIGTASSWTARVGQPELPKLFRDLKLLDSLEYEPATTTVYINDVPYLNLVMYGLAKVVYPHVRSVADEDPHHLMEGGDYARDLLRRARRYMSRTYENFYNASTDVEDAANLALLRDPTPEMLTWKKRMLVVRALLKPHSGRRDLREERRELAERWLFGKGWGFSDRAIVGDTSPISTRYKDLTAPPLGLLLLPLVWFFALCPREDWPLTLGNPKSIYSAASGPEIRTRWGDFVMDPESVTAVIELDSEFALAHQPATLLFLRDDVGLADLERMCYLQALEFEGKPLLRRAKGRVEAV